MVSGQHSSAPPVRPLHEPPSCAHVPQLALQHPNAPSTMPSLQYGSSKSYADRPPPPQSEFSSMGISHPTSHESHAESMESTPSQAMSTNCCSAADVGRVTESRVRSSVGMYLRGAPS